jgi:hypothetical protein
MKQPVYNSSEICDAVEQYLERLPASPAPTPTPLTEEELDAIDWLKTAHNNFKDDDNIRRCWLISTIIERLSASPTAPKGEA